REFPFDKPGIKRFLDNWHDHFDVDVRKCTLYQDVKGGIAPQGIEYYLPLFFDQTATLFDYLPQDALIFTGSQLPEAIEQFWREVSERYEEYRGDRQRPLLPPAKLYLGAGEVFAAIGRHPRTDLVAGTAPARAGATNFPARAPDTVAVDSRPPHPLPPPQPPPAGTPAPILWRGRHRPAPGPPTSRPGRRTPWRWTAAPPTPSSTSKPC